MSNKYRFTGVGKKHYGFVKGMHKLLEVGDIVELQDDTAISFRDRFEPAAKGDKAALSRAVNEAQTAAKARAEEESAAAAAKIGGNVRDAVAKISKIKEAGDLDAIEAAEKAGNNRLGVLRAIKQRRAELSK